MWCSCRRQPTLSHFVPFLSTPTPCPFLPPRCFLQESLVVNMIRGRYCPVLGTQPTHSSHGQGRYLARFRHSDHGLILLVHFQDLTPFCQEEVAPTTDFPSDPAGVSQLTAGYHSCDQVGDYGDRRCSFLGRWPLLSVSGCGSENLKLSWQLGQGYSKLGWLWEYLTAGLCSGFTSGMELWYW